MGESHADISCLFFFFLTVCVRARTCTRARCLFMADLEKRILSFFGRSDVVEVEVGVGLVDGAVRPPTDRTCACLGSPSYPGTIMQTGNYHFNASGSSSIAGAAVVYGGGHRKLTRAENSRAWRN